jgi:hypothetical protein
MDMAKPGKEHEWLNRLIGDWAYEVEAACNPGEPPAKFGGTERVRPVGGLWIIAEGQGEMPGGGTAQMILTLGFDPDKRRFVGTWVGSMMTTLWVYQGSLDESGKRLTLETTGPSHGEPGKTANYREMIELTGDTSRTFTSTVQASDGTWSTMMTARYQRTS